MNQKIIKNNQQGVALVMALIMLLIITILGVSAVRMSGLDTQIAGNSIYSIMAFQGAESGLGRSISTNPTTRKWFHLGQAASNRALKKDIDTTDFPDELVTGGAKLDAKITVEYENILNGPVFNNVANSSKFRYQVFKYTSDSQVQATSAQDRHSEGRAALIPTE